MDRYIKVLHLEDDEKDAFLVKRTLEKEFDRIIFTRVFEVENFKHSLKEGGYDIILSDFSMPSFNGLEALKIARELSPGTPYIYVSGHIGEDRAIEALKMGASDYVLKDKLSKLVPAMKRAIKEVEEKEKAREISEELKISEELYRRIFEYAPIGIAQVSADGIFLSANFALQNMIGFSEDELKSMKFSDMTYYEDRESSKEEFQAVVSFQKEVSNFEKRYVTKKGTAIWVNLTSQPVRKENGEVLYMVAMVENINDRKLAELALRESEKRFKDLTLLLPLTVFEIDEDGVVTYVNKAGLETFLYSEDEIGDDTVIDQFIHPQSRSMIHQKMEQAFKGEQFGGVEFTAIRKDGTEFPSIVYANPILLGEKIVGLRGILIDNTEREKTLEELVRAKKTAEEMNQLKSTFFANMSHELRTPMIGILGYSRLLMNEIKNTEHQEMIQSIYASANRLMQTLNLILDLSRIEANMEDVSYQKLDIPEIVKEIVKAFQGFAQDKGLYLNIVLKEDRVSAELDERLFSQILNNLLNNALKFTNKGGVTVEVDKEHIENTDWAVVKVKDTGIGIPKGSLGVIFEEFRQLSEGYARSYEGTGIGLSITKKSVELMNGKILVDSTKGKGSVFSVLFPVASETVGAHVVMNDSETVAEEFENPGTPTSHILIVDNDRPTQLFISQALRDHYFVDLAEDGLSAIELVAKNKYSIIFMDIGLGYGMNGIETMKKIREIKGYKDTPVIAITAYAMEEDKELLLSEGFTRYMMKPFTAKDLRVIIYELLSDE